MGYLRSVVDERMGGDVTDNGVLVPYFRQSSEFMYNKYKRPDEYCEAINLSSISKGYFYFFMYADESNWMQLAPVFLCDWKKFDNKIIGYGVNFNFIPIQYRVAIFDKIINNLTDDNQLSSVNFESMYKILLSVGYEYAIVEFDMSRMKRVYKISYSILPEFLCHTHPAIKYDPINLYNIWKKKLETKADRHQEMIKLIADEFYNVTGEISDKYKELKSHINRLSRNNSKFGS